MNAVDERHIRDRMIALHEMHGRTDHRLIDHIERLTARVSALETEVAELRAGRLVVLPGGDA